MKEQIQTALDRWFDDFEQALEHPERRGRGQPVIALPPRLISRILSPKRVELLELLGRRRVRSISELAELAGRKIDVVSRDLKVLCSFGLIRYERHGKRKEPVAAARHVLIELSQQRPDADEDRAPSQQGRRTVTAAAV